MNAWQGTVIGGAEVVVGGAWSISGLSWLTSGRVVAHPTPFRLTSLCRWPADPRDEIRTSLSTKFSTSHAGLCTPCGTLTLAISVSWCKKFSKVTTMNGSPGGSLHQCDLHTVDNGSSIAPPVCASAVRQVEFCSHCLVAVTHFPAPGRAPRPEEEHPSSSRVIPKTQGRTSP